MTKTQFTLLLVLTTFSIIAQPSAYRFFHLTEKDGFSTRYNPSMVEDKKRGFRWFGTKSGIWRYDGEVLLKVYPKSENGNLETASHLAITLYLADSKGDVWFFDDKKCIRRLSHSSGEVQTFRVHAERRDSAISFFGSFYIGDIYEDRKGRIWANTTSHGLLIFEEKNSCFVPAPMSQTLYDPGNTGKIYEDVEGWFWFGNHMMPVRYNPETSETWFCKNNPLHWPVFDLTASVFFVDSRQKMWLAEFTHGYRYDLKTQKVEILPEVYQASEFAEDELGRVWFGRYYNPFLTYYDPNTNRFEKIYPDENNPEGLHVSEWICYIHMDSRGILWVLDVANINAFEPTKARSFQLFKNNPVQREKALPLGEVSDVYYASDGRYYVSYWMPTGGMVVLDSNFQVQEKWGWGGKSTVFHQKAMWNAIEDNDSQIWMSQQEGGISIYNLKTHQLRKFICPEFKGSSPYLAVKDSNGDLWWGLWHSKGLVKWDRLAKKFTNFTIAPSNHGSIYSIVESDSSIFWLSTDLGIIKFDRKTGKSVSGFLPPSTDTTEWLRKVVVGLVKTNDSTLIGNCFDGFFEFSLKTEKFTRIKLQNGTKTPLSLTPLMFDGSGAICSGYLGGLIRFWPDTKQLTILPLTEHAGFPFQGRVFRNSLHNGRFALGANDRFFILDITTMSDEQPPPVPRVTQILIDGDALALGRDIEQNILLRHDENYFLLNFSSFLPFQWPVFYSYRLRGLRDEWSQPLKTPFARFTNVPPGRYFFEVRAHFSQGEPSEASSQMIEIRHPFWQTWWFVSLSVAAFFGLVWLVLQIRLRQQLEKEAIRFRIAQDLHDEVSSTLSSISILSESAMIGVQKDLDQARFGNIGDKARNALESISDIVWSINPKNDSMAMVLSRMSAFASEILEGVGTVLHFKSNEEVESLNIPMGKRKDFYLLFKEAIHNCAKHAQAKHVEIKLEKQGNVLTLSVKDDGVGFDMQKTAAVTTNLGGNGLQNMYSRAKAMGADMKVNSTSGVGTELILKVPLST